MTVLHETIEVERPLHEVFSYISDFSTTREWDATAFEARKLTPGAISVGTEYEVECALPVGSVTLIYKVEKIVPDKYLRLRGTSKLFDVIDCISFTPTDNGTQVDYQATFEFNALVQPFAALSRSGMQKMGRDALAGMKRALEDNFDVVEHPGLTDHADRWVVPGLGLFTKLGYRLARKHFNPVSAFLENKHVVVTGASSGLGKEIAQDLALRRHANLLLVARRSDSLREVKAEIEERAKAKEAEERRILMDRQSDARNLCCVIDELASIVDRRDQLLRLSIYLCSVSNGPSATKLQNEVHAYIELDSEFSDGQLLQKLDHINCFDNDSPLIGSLLNESINSRR